MSSRITKTSTTKTVVRSSDLERKGSVDVSETKAALLIAGHEPEQTKNGSHGASDTTVAVEDADGNKTPEGSLRIRTLTQIKKRVSQEFAKSSMAKKWAAWFIHVIFAILPYVAILIGAVFRMECWAESRLPIHLIVSGVIMAVVHLSVSVDLYRGLGYLKSRQKPAIFTLLWIFMIIWMILGLVWVFGIFIPDHYDVAYIRPYEYNPWNTWNSWNKGYCNWSVYWFALIFNVISLVSLLVAGLVCCCCCDLLCNVSVVTCLCGDDDEDETSSPVQV